MTIDEHRKNKWFASPRSDWQMVKGLLMATIIQTLVLTPLKTAAAKTELTDSAVNAAVVSDLHSEMPAFPNFLNVSTQNGIVVLSGSVNNILAKRRSVKIAGSVRGVLGVIDRINVTPGHRPDEVIRKEILTALRNDPATESYKVAVSVNDGVATLTGSVGPMAETRLAQLVAEGVSGVKDIHNNLTINYAAARTDREIAAEIKDILHWDIWATRYPVQVVVKDGNVTLTGTVGSVDEKSRVNQDAWVTDVWFVDDSGLKVDPAARDRMRRESENPMRSDSEIKAALQLALRADPRVSHYVDKINITVECGMPSLEGTVGDLKVKSAAGADAGNIVGVELVDNELSVQPTAGSPDSADTKSQRAGMSVNRPLAPG